MAKVRFETYNLNKLSKQELYNLHQKYQKNLSQQTEHLKQKIQRLGGPTPKAFTQSVITFNNSPNPVRKSLNSLNSINANLEAIHKKKYSNNNNNNFQAVNGVGHLKLSKKIYPKSKSVRLIPITKNRVKNMESGYHAGYARYLRFVNEIKSPPPRPKRTGRGTKNPSTRKIPIPRGRKI
jgi:hypothetical protein